MGSGTHSVVLWAALLLLPWGTQDALFFFLFLVFIYKGDDEMARRSACPLPPSFGFRCIRTYSPSKEQGYSSSSPDPG